MSYEPPILSRNLGYGDAKVPESVTKSHSRLSQGEKPGMYNAYLQFVNSLKPEISRIHRVILEGFILKFFLHVVSEWFIEIIASTKWPSSATRFQTSHRSRLEERTC